MAKPCSYALRLIFLTLLSFSHWFITITFIIAFIIARLCNSVTSKCYFDDDNNDHDHDLDDDHDEMMSPLQNQSIMLQFYLHDAVYL